MIPAVAAPPSIEKHGFRIVAVPNEAQRKVGLRLTASPGDRGGSAFGLTIGGVGLPGWELGDGDSADLTMDFDHLRAQDWNDLRLWDLDRQIEIPKDRYELEGEIFQAGAIASEARFWHDVQAHHTRFKSSLALELGAKTALERFQDFKVRAAALTILAHRVIEKVPADFRDADIEWSRWLINRAELVISEGERLIGQGGDAPDWEHVRWTVSLSTVTGYLCLIDDRLAAANESFAVCVRYVDLVSISKVSALNLVNACALHGILSHLLLKPDIARESLKAGVTSLPAIVATQNLMENVWVIGDLINCARSARQCYIALVRLGLFGGMQEMSGPIVDDTAVLMSAEIEGPLKRLLRFGRAPALARHFTKYGMI